MAAESEPCYHAAPHALRLRVNRPAAAAPPRVLLLGAFATIYLVWGSTYLAISIAIETLPPFLMAASRFLIAGVLLYAWARARGVPAPDRRNWGAAALLGALFLLLGNGGVVWAEQRVPSGLAAVLVALLPIWTAIIEWARPGGRRPTGWVVVGLLTGFVGVALLLAPTSDGVAHVDPLGAIVLMLASLSWAVAGVIARDMPLPASGSLASGMQMLAGGAWLAIVSVASGEPADVNLEAVSLGSALAVAYLIVFGSLIAFSAFTWLLRVSTPGRVATYAYVNPVVAVLLGWAIASEPFGPRDLVAAGVIVLGVVVITSAKAKRRPAELSE